MPGSKISVLGRIARGPEFRQTDSGLPRCNFTVAVNYPKPPPEQDLQATDWYNVTCLGPTASFANRYLARGKRVQVHGRLTSRVFTGREGRDRALDVLADNYGIDIIDWPDDIESTTAPDDATTAPATTPAAEAAAPVPDASGAADAQQISEESQAA